MTNYFVDMVFIKKKRVRTIIKTSFIAILVFVVLFIISKITSVILINSAVKSVFEKFGENPDNKVEYERKIDILGSKVIIKNMYISVNTGTIDMGEVVLSPKSGFIIPSSISVKPKGISTETATGRKYDIMEKNGKFEFIIKLNRHLTSMPTFGGIETRQPLEFVFVEKNTNIGEVKIEKLKLLINGNETYTDYKGNLIFHDGDFVPNVILLDRPFKWDIKLYEVKTKKAPKLYTQEDKEIVNNLTIQNATLDFDFSKVEVSGKSTYGTVLYSTDLNVDITNYNKFVDAVFNMIIQTREGNVSLFKKMHKTIKQNIIPLLRKNSENKKDILSLKLKKSEDDGDVVVNGTMSMTDIVQKLAKS